MGQSCISTDKMETDGDGEGAVQDTDNVYEALVVGAYLLLLQ